MSPREAELRDRVRSILAANRELGPRYEDAAVAQIVDLLQGRMPQAAKPARPAPAPRSWSPLAVVALAVVALVVGMPVLRAAFGVLAGVLDAFAWVLFAFACIFVIRLFRRMTRAIDRPRAYDAWQDERGHRWRRVY